MAKRGIVQTKQCSDLYTVDDLQAIITYPHIIGHLAGYTKLTSMHSDWIHYIWDWGNDPSDPDSKGEFVRNLWAHRGGFKTSGCTVIGSIYRMLLFPNQSQMIVRKTFSESADTLADIVKAMKVPEIRELFRFAHGEEPKVKTEKIGEAKLDFSFRKSAGIAPSVRGMGVNSAFTGTHADVIVGDDISTIVSRLSKAERKKDQQIWREIAGPIVNKGPNRFIRYVGTPWCPPGSGGIEDLLPPPLKYDCYSTGLLSEHDIALSKQQSTSQLFAANYELKFIAQDDVIFADPKYDTWWFENTDTIRAHVDMSYGGIDSTAFTIASNRADGKLQAIGWLFQGNGPEFIDKMCELMKQYKCKTIAVETNSDKGYTSIEFKKRGMIVKDYPENTNKVNKICTYGVELWPRVVWSHDTDPNYLSQIVDFTADSKSQDDAPDSFASICRAFYSKKGSNAERWQL